PLRLDDGGKVTSASAWWRQRRPQIVAALEDEVYGHIPEGVPKVTWQVTAMGKESLQGHPIAYKRLLGHVDNSAYPAISVDIPVTLVLPVAAKGRVPVLIMFWFGPTPVPPTEPNDRELGEINGALRSALERDDPSLRAAFRGAPGAALISRSQFSALRRNADGDPPSIVELIAAGWGFAVLDPTIVQADNGAGLTRGIIGLTNRGQPRTPGQWGALRAWAWAASRTLDYLETDPEVDAKHVGIEGVSRYGKAALVTEAFDQRFAMGLIGSSGKGGATLLRRNFGEAVESLTGGEYYWMAGNFMKYGASEASFGSMRPGDLPVDSNELIALTAPRLTFISYGIPAKGDAKWLDHEGSWMATVDASRVWQLLGAKGLEGVEGDYRTAKMPPVNQGLLGGRLAWRQDDGGHTDAPNMKWFLEWADKFIGHGPQS